ncbi:hypothetical protein [Haladaptatus sp. NG-WS-4]
MRGEQHRFNGDARVLYQLAVRTPVPDTDAERLFHEKIMSVADARERKGTASGSSPEALGLLRL